MPLAGRAHLAPGAMWPAKDPLAAARMVTLASGERVRIVESGSADAPPVVLLHGWGCSAFSWRFIAAGLVADGHRTISIDLRGHGLSDRSDEPSNYTREAMIDHLAATLDVLALSRVPLVAHSMGGAVAMGLTLRDPDRVARLALFGAVGFGEVDRAAWSQLLPPSLTGALLPSRIPRWAVKFALQHSRGERGMSDEQEVDEYWAPTQFPAFLNAMRLLLHGFTWTPWTPTELASVSQPILLIFGDKDPVVRPRRVVPILARCLSTATLHVAQGAGHVVMEERPEWALALLRPFLAPDRLHG